MASVGPSTNFPLGFAVITTEDGMTAVQRVSRRSPDGVQVIPVEDMRLRGPSPLPAHIERFAGAVPDDIVLLAERDLKTATAAFEEAGQIEAALAERLNARSAQIQLAADKLRKSLEKTAAQS